MRHSSPYLQRRGYGLTFRISVPSDLRHIVGTREITKALATSSRNLAIPIALEFAACAKRMFGELRMVMAAGDDEQRQTLSLDFSKLKEVSREALHRIEKRELQDEFDSELQKQRRDHLQELERVRLASENETLRCVIKSLGSLPAHPALPPPVAPLGTPAATRTPAVAAEKSAARHRLSEVLPVWKRLKSPALSTIEIYEAAINRFEMHFPKLHAETIEKRDIREYVEKLQSLGLSGKTIEKEHGAIRALLTIAEHEEWINSNPASGILLPEIKGKKVRSYTPAECNQVFSSPVFTSKVRPTGCKGDAAYWIPLLLLFTGARREEIAQLTTDRVRKSENFHFLAIDPFDEDGHLKTDESKRSVPIHRVLERIGFLDFVDRRRKEGGGQLFQELKPNRRGQYGAKWGDWWRRYVREDVGITDKQIHPAHSFRHLFITECRRLSFREDYERALVGHTRGGRKDAHDGYGEHLIPSLAAELNRIDFRELNLKHLWET